ncbi:MAG: hypothetical protein ACK46G_12805, partial [Flavobacteriales bacterium]
MMRRLYALLVPAILLPVLAVLLPEAPPEERLVIIAADLQQRVADRQQALERLVSERAAALGATACDRPGDAALFQATDRARADVQGTEFLLLCRGRLAAWSGVSPVPVADVMDTGTM